MGDDQTRIASPVGVVTIRNPEHGIEQIGRMIDEHQPDALVVGLPLNMDATEGPAAKRTRVLAKRLEQQFRLQVNLVDERLTSFAAEERLNGSGLTRKQKKSRRDALAAAQILQDFFHS